MARGRIDALAVLAGAALLGIIASARGATRRRPHPAVRPEPPTGAPRRSPRMAPVKDAPPPTVRGSYLNRRSDTHLHRGIDQHGAAGDPVRAAEGGTVAHAGPERPGFGGYGPYYVVIDHGGVWSLYGHLDGLRVRPGDRVGRGELVGAIADGATPHVHFEVAHRPYPMDSEAERVDPLAWLRGEL